MHRSISVEKKTN